jgi:hypothetical protein
MEGGTSGSRQIFGIQELYRPKTDIELECVATLLPLHTHPTPSSCYVHAQIPAPRPRPRPRLTRYLFYSIVAIHGLNGDALKTWTYESGNQKINWLSHPDFLPRYLHGARVLTWGYNANTSSFKGRQTSSDRILQHAATLVAQLQADREVGGFPCYFIRLYWRKPAQRYEHHEFCLCRC